MEKSTIGLRIKDIRARLGLTQSEFGNHISSTKQQVSNWERGAESPSVSKMQEIAALGSVTFEWLAFGGKVNINQEPNLSNKIPVVRKFGLQGFNKEDVLREEPIVDNPGQFTDLFYFPMDSEALMDASNKSIRPGDLLMTGMGVPCLPGDLVICLTKDQRHLVRYYTVSGNTITLKATNPAFPDINLSRDDILLLVRVISVKPLPFSL